MIVGANAYESYGFFGFRVKELASPKIQGILLEGKHMTTVSIAFRNGFTADDLNDRLRSNARYGFISANATKAKGKRAAYIWQHPKHGKLTLKKDDGLSWAEISNKSNLLLGAFMYWLFENASDMVGWVEIYRD